MSLMMFSLWVKTESVLKPNRGTSIVVNHIFSLSLKFIHSLQLFQLET